MVEKSSPLPSGKVVLLKIWTQYNTPTLSLLYLQCSSLKECTKCKTNYGHATVIYFNSCFANLPPHTLLSNICICAHLISSNQIHVLHDRYSLTRIPYLPCSTGAQSSDKQSLLASMTKLLISLS